MVTITKKVLKLGYTTTTLTKIRGFSVKILKALKEGPKTAPQLSLELCARGEYLRPYLHNLRKYGLVEKNGTFWQTWEIIPDRIDIVNKIININNKVKEEVKVSKRRVKAKVKEENASLEERARALKLSENFERFLQQKKLHDEVVVVKVLRKLFEHYLETGSKFVVFTNPEDMEVFFGCYREEIGKAFARLINERVAYKWQHTGEIKLALYGDFVKKLWEPQSGILESF
jgi:predicted DNA-binding ArsR family transcriptional regulator